MLKRLIVVALLLLGISELGFTATTIPENAFWFFAAAVVVYVLIDD
jgi:hypothetical protein